MLQAYSNNISGTANTAVVFSTNKINTNKNITHNTNSADILINTPGFYKVTIDASYSAADAGLVSLQLFANNVAIEDAISSITVVASSLVNGVISTIIKANPGIPNQSITLNVKPTADITISNINISINRLP